MKIRHVHALVMLLVLSFLCGFPYATALEQKQDALVLGIFPRRNATITMKLFSPLASYLEQQLKREIILETTKDFKTFWLGVASQRYDIVHYNQLHYIVSHAMYGYDVILKNEEFNKDTLASVIIVRKDSGINSLSELRGKKIVFGGDKTAMIAYVMAKAMLQRAGLNHGDYQEEFANNPPNACLATFYKQADASAAGEFVFKLPVIKNKIDIEQLRIIAKSERLAHLPWAVSKKIDPSTKLQIQNILLLLNNSESGQNILRWAKLSGIKPAVDHEYDLHREINNANSAQNK